MREVSLERCTEEDEVPATGSFWEAHSGFQPGINLRGDSQLKLVYPLHVPSYLQTVQVQENVSDHTGVSMEEGWFEGMWTQNTFFLIASGEIRLL